MKKFIRESDKKEFLVTVEGHWNKIQSTDGECDLIKWYGPDKFGYVSFDKGHKYDDCGYSK